jgi:CBS domain-containing protein
LTFIDGYKYAKISAIVCLTKKGIKKIPWRYVIELGDKINDTRFKVGIYLNCLESEMQYSRKNEISLNSILDKQLVDVNGARIIRVNDIILGEIEGNFCVVAVDISTKGIVRRLGFLSKLGDLLPRFEEHVLPWRYVQALHKCTKEIHVKCKREKMLDLHPADLADMMHDLSAEGRVLMFDTLDRKKAAETLIVSNLDIKRSVFGSMSLKRIAELLENMSYNEAATILTLMPLIKNEKVLRLMKKEKAENIRKLLSYDKSSAGAIMSTEFIAIPDSFTVKQAISFLKKEMPSPNKIHYFYVKNNANVLIGVVSLRDMILFNQKEKVASLIKRNIVSVRVNTHVEDVFNIMNKYKLLALPVLSRDGKIVGVIRISDALNALLPLRIKKQRIPEKYKRKKRNGKDKHS